MSIKISIKVHHSLFPGVMKINFDGSKEVVEDSDLWWALRGGGPGLGVVISFKLKLYDAPAGIVKSLTMYPLQ